MRKIVYINSLRILNYFWPFSVGSCFCNCLRIGPYVINLDSDFSVAQNSSSLMRCLAKKEKTLTTGGGGISSL